MNQCIKKSISKTKIKSYNNKINMNFHDSGMPKIGSPSVCLPEILIDYIFTVEKIYYPQLWSIM